MAYDALAKHSSVCVTRTVDNVLSAVCVRVKPVGKPDAVAPHVRFDERGWETGLYATAPILDSTGWAKIRKVRHSLGIAHLYLMPPRSKA